MANDINISKTPNLAPVLFLSHGTTMMLGTDSRTRDYWEALGRDALRHGAKGVIIMGAHWNSLEDKIHVAMNPNPSIMPISNTLPDLWANFRPNPDLATGQRVIDTLRAKGFDVDPDHNFNWMIDTVPLLIGMFKDKCPPVTIISQNSHWDPFFHARVGAALRHLREERYLLIGSGGGVHNLYLTEWKYMLQYKDNFAMEQPPEPKTIEFRQSLEDIICKNGGGPELQRGLTRLMKHPYFRDAHGTDEHYISACFVAGAVSSVEDKGTKGCLGAEAWELCESQFCLGTWPEEWLD
ncbi:Extradiol ring-cleavage dioxygenase, class III enzyme, subunit B [Aspergillus pseudotamarii]|uniref:Extradiol ring-cleavage dioxygenase, class III enzyme, subunit B n=1 Tax=Aspergillus pseudotamarii TaxID=132259 RepID=A0A5N6SN52_ASPPS|nr:Extradiol ring-cleavage dioxygenase, class III enzyme, subunit B [Aspergillus pseudotamarii]KAE8136112.1 Extradiol ring-cleavage dioxygenase, class III enzyme, subunit B [Aspergillus pseudotamarii]